MSASWTPWHFDMTEIAADVSVDYGRLRSQLVFISAKKRVAHGCESGKARLDHIYRLKKPWRHALKTSKDEVIMYESYSLLCPLRIFCEPKAQMGREVSRRLCDGLHRIREQQ